MRVIGAITIRLGTVSPFRETGRDRISAAREAAVSLTERSPRVGSERRHSDAERDIPGGMCTCINHPSTTTREPRPRIPPRPHDTCDPDHAQAGTQPDRAPENARGRHP
ncbi:hypothetical protein GCM10023335_26010 [Streptomyces siamensis]|uniref:Uncharacterized protein n=1 Tax=Streptomyces siamensis TaxID=1274986 RepID=A0ABP9IS21_9ACTN